MDKYTFKCHGALYQIGSSLFKIKGSRSKDIIESCNFYLSSDDLYTRKEALILMIIEIRKVIKENHIFT